MNLLGVPNQSVDIFTKRNNVLPSKCNSTFMPCCSITQPLRLSNCVDLPENESDCTQRVQSSCTLTFPLNEDGQ